MVAGSALFLAGCYLAWRSRWFDAVDVALDVAWGGAAFAAFFGGFVGYKAVHWLGLVPA
jgi:hypothetical protein